MKKNNRYLIVSVLIAGLAGSVSIAAAEYGMSGGKGQHGHRSSMGHTKKYDHGQDKKGHLFGEYWKDTLTDDQRSKLDKTHLAMKKEIVVLKAQIALAKAELSVLAVETKPDTQEINTKIAKILEWKQSLLEERYAHILEMREILTPAQRVSFDMGVLNNSKKKGRKKH